MKKLRNIFIGTLIIGKIFAQADVDYVNDNVLRYDDYTYKANIKTVQLHEESWDHAAPIINLASGEKLEISFDDLDADQKQYSVTFIHCNANWTPSDLMTTEYIDGFTDLNFINFSFSINTIQKFTHYSLKFPQLNVKFTKSGNYIALVYLNGDKNEIAITRRFMVYDNKVNVGHTFRQSIGDDDQFSKQHLDFTINYGQYNIVDPNRNLQVVIMQNNRWDNAVTNIKPTFLGGGQLTYSLDDASTFLGGNEFRYFDIRSTRFLTERVKDVYRDEKMMNHAKLVNEESRATKPYLFYNDFNGGFVIKNRETSGNQDIEADYIYVDFFMPYLTPESAGNFYLLGKLTDWRMNSNSMLKYNYARMGYEKQLYLKQGFYNYIIVLSNDTKTGGDESVMEGSFWDTENDYTVLVYHRVLGTYFDQLIGYKKINSLRK
ncbi:MAG: DUF5103 domain-containing protein [Sphingobacteriaceae bacterium]|nr:DUF5103 domain-containing protein [Sphingobacteriaceae bacterium]